MRRQGMRGYYLVSNAYGQRRNINLQGCQSYGRSHRKRTHDQGTPTTEEHTS